VKNNFDAAWDHLARMGACDARGGMEYQRCKADWLNRAELVAAMAFILTAANEPPPPVAADQQSSRASGDDAGRK
jgi:hypothetical protein